MSHELCKTPRNLQRRLLTHDIPVFFRAPQDDLTVEEQKHVTYMLGKLTGRPEGHGLHVHPLYNDPNNLEMADGTKDPNMYVWNMFHVRFVLLCLTLHRYVINSEAMKKLYKTMKTPQRAVSEPRDLSREWHSDSKLPLFPGS